MTDTPYALISGASSGIGLATTRSLLKQGYRVTGISRRDPSAEIDDPRFSSLSCDLTNLEAIEALTASNAFGQAVDCFIHAAGAGSFGSLEQFSAPQIDRSIRLNLTSAMLLSRRLLPAMRQRAGGQMIFIGSESALTAGRKGALYSAAKFGLRGFCQALSADCAADGIRVSLVNPGMVRSPFFDDLNFRPAAADENAITVQDVADVICQILQSSDHILLDEINLSPRVKSIDFSRSKD